jgi:hypothetical protein
VVSCSYHNDNLNHKIVYEFTLPYHNDTVYHVLVGANGIGLELNKSGARLRIHVSHSNLKDFSRKEVMSDNE